MSFWRRLLGKGKSSTLRPQRLDYLNEALALERQGDFEAALTSYRLALRDNAQDTRILQNMAIAFGAHYGVAFLLLKRGDAGLAADHLRAFLARPPKGPDADRWVKHAEAALEDAERAVEGGQG